MPEEIYDESAFIDDPVAGPPCYWAKDPKVGRYYVPGCMGAAVYGPRGCTCGTKVTEQKMVERERRQYRSCR